MLSAEDRDALRRLAGEISSISRNPVKAERADLWHRLNDLEPILPAGLDQRDPMARDGNRGGA